MKPANVLENHLDLGRHVPASDEHVEWSCTMSAADGQRSADCPTCAVAAWRPVGAESSPSSALA